MSETTSLPEQLPPPPGGPASPAGPLFLWLAIQLGALWVAAMRVPLWARYPQAGELLALQILITVQAAGAAMLFPLLFRTVRQSIMIVTVTAPFLLFAWTLTAIPLAAFAWGAACLGVWLMTLAAWRFALKGRPTQLLAMALATTWSVGGPILIYLENEFGERQVAAISPDLLGPIVTAVQQITGTPRTRSPWIILAVLLAAGLFADFVVHRRRSKSE